VLLNKICSPVVHGIFEKKIFLLENVTEVRKPTRYINVVCPILEICKYMHDC
jgi:hypothetical protein